MLKRDECVFAGEQKKPVETSLSFSARGHLNIWCRVCFPLRDVHMQDYPSKCMKCAQILWELCFFRHQTGALGEIARHSKLKDVAIYTRNAPALSWVLSSLSSADIYVRRPSGNKDRICSTGTKCQFSYTHTRAARNKSWLSSLFYFLSDGSFKGGRKGGAPYSTCIYAVYKKKCEQMLGYNMSFFCTQLPFLCNWLLNAHTQVFLSGNFSNKAFSKFITLLFMPKKASLCVRTGSLCRINISWN